MPVRHLGVACLIQVTILISLLSGGVRAAEPVQEVIGRLQSADPIKRRVAAQELLTLKNPDAAPALIKALDDKDAYVRTLAARALGYMRWSPAQDKLANAALTDKDRQVRETALM